MKRVTFFILFVGYFFCLSAQPFTSKSLFTTKGSGNKFPGGIIHRGESLLISKPDLDKIYNLKPSKLLLQIPFEGKTMLLDLEAYQPLSNAFRVVVSGAENAKEIYPYQKGVFYKGKLRNEKKSFVAVSFFNNEMAAVISDTNSNITLGSLKPAGLATDNYVMYRNTDAELPYTIKCLTEESGSTGKISQRGLQTNGTAIVGCPVDVYVEADHSCYTKNGSNVSNTVNFVATIMNGVSAVYLAENISMQLREVKVWTTDDPYSAIPDARDVLKAFKAKMAVGYNGHLAHLFSTLTKTNGVTGVSAVGVLCNADPGTRCGFSTTLNTSVPTSDINTYIVAHELGHNLGSLHTHNCTWIGGALDNCYPPEGTCAPGPPPVNGGTIMSYCAVNLANGFGKQPGDKIRAEVAAATCLCTCDNMEVTISQASINCDSKGTATANVKGLTTAANFTWDDGEKLATATKLTAGWHYVTVVSQATPTCKIIRGVDIKLTLPSTSTPPKPSVTFSGGLLSSSAAGGNQWFLNGVVISGATNKTFTPAAEGDYSVQVTISGCVSPVSDVFHFTVSGPPVTTTDIQIFPNPVISSVTVKNINGKNLLIQLYDIVGQNLLSTSTNSPLTLLDMRSYAAAAYVILITDSDTGVKIKKVIIKK